MTYQDPDPLRDRDLDRDARIDRNLDGDARMNRNKGSNAMWGWIAGAVALALMLVFLFGGTTDNANTASKQPNAPVVNTPPANNIANAPRGSVSPPAAETAGQGSTSPSNPQQ